MSEPSSSVDNERFAEAEVRQTRGISMVWLIPLVALIAGGWLVWSTLSEKGPLVEITFLTATGIEAGKTRVKYKDVVVGLVERVEIAEDLKHVYVYARINTDMAVHISENSRFWVVRPRFGASGISGLSTIVSGAFVAVDPGPEGDSEYEFEGLEEPPAIASDSEGRSFTLRADSLGSLSVGSPVYYRQIRVGEITRYALADGHDAVNVDLFVYAPHDQYVRTNTRFWNVAGLSVDMGTEGFKLEMESLIALLSGGVAFYTPESLEPEDAAPEGQIFDLYNDRRASEEQTYTRKLSYLMYFDDNVRGLRVGAPVEFRGIKVGKVLDIRMELDGASGGIRIPVLVEIEPDRIGSMNQLRSDPREVLDTLIASGLRGQLTVGSLLTGQLVVDLDLYPDEPIIPLALGGRFPELPTLPMPLTSITENVSKVLAKVAALPIEEIGQEALLTAEGVRVIATAPELMESVRALNRTLDSVESTATAVEGDVPPMVSSLNRAADGIDRLVGTVNRQAGPLLQQVEAAVAATGPLLTQTTETVKQGERTLRTLEGVARDDSPIGRELLTALEELSAAARAIRVMAEYLERHPDALVKGKVN